MTTAQTRELRAELLALQGVRCLVPSCTRAWQQMAHIEPSGMGGRPSLRRASNLAGLCGWHHDIFDGRRLEGRQELMRELMASLAASR